MTLNMTVVLVSLVLLLTVLCKNTYGLLPPEEGEDIRKLEYAKLVAGLIPPHSLRAGITLTCQYVDHAGHVTNNHVNPSIKICITQHVSQTTLQKATTVIGLMVKNMPLEIFSSVANTGHGVGIFSSTAEKLTVFPEMSSLRDTPACQGKCPCQHTCTADNRKYDDLGGLTNALSAISMEHVMCIDRKTENVLVHEFAHQIHNYLPTADRNRLNYVYNLAKQHHSWTTNTYAMSNVFEYWAVATQAYFGVTHRENNVAAGMDMCGPHLCGDEAANRAALKQHDPGVYELLTKVYTNNQPSTVSGLKVCQ